MAFTSKQTLNEDPLLLHCLEHNIYNMITLFSLGVYMKHKTDIVFFYIEKLGLLSFQELIIAHQQSMEIEEYLKKKNLQQYDIYKLKFIVLKHFLMMAAEKDGVLNKSQVTQLMNQKVLLLKNNNPPFSMLSIDCNLISPVYFQETIAKLDREKIFSIGELRELVTAKFFILPEEHKKVVANLIENIGIFIKKETIVVGDHTLNKHQIKCSCGSLMHIEIEEKSEVRVYCTNCKKLVLDTLIRKSMASQTIGNTLSEYTKSIDWEHESKRFANYELIKKLGEGTAGKVYMVKRIDTSEIVALKILQKADKPEYINYFTREIALLKELKHPNIIALKSWGEHNGKPYFTMEYIEGPTLEDIIDKGLNYIQSVKIITYILNALMYANENNLVHRDIKPANIIISQSGHIKLIDLGIAKILEDSLGLTKSGQMMGTPYYVSIEQIGDSKHVTHQADIYSVGATLFHCLCGVPPFIEYKDSIVRLLMQKVKDQYIPLEQRNPNLPKMLYYIVKKSMAADLSERYKSADEMKQDIIKFQHVTFTMSKISKE